MKNNKFKMLLIIIMTVFPSIVMANDGSRAIKPYVAIVTNTEGANYYNNYYYSNDIETPIIGTVPYGTKIVICYEWSRHDYVSFYVGDTIDNEKCHKTFIDIKDIAPVNKEYKPQDSEKAKETEELLITSDTYLRNGPSVGYDKKDILVPKGEKLIITHSTVGWGYTSYNGVFGWVATYRENALQNETSDPTIRDIECIDINNEEKLIIPKGTIIDQIYGNVSDGSYAIYNNKICKFYFGDAFFEDDLHYNKDNNVENNQNIVEPIEKNGNEELYYKKSKISNKKIIIIFIVGAIILSVTAFTFIIKFNKKRTKD